MAAITKTKVGSGFRRTASAQANTGQTDWLEVPRWAKYCHVLLDITAVAGTTPIVTPALLTADPISADDANVAAITVAAFTTAPTAAGTHIIVVGPNVAAAEETVMAATGDSTSYVNTVLPDLLGVQLTLDRGSANETYTYTLNVSFKA